MKDGRIGRVPRVKIDGCQQGRLGLPGPIDHDAGLRLAVGRRASEATTIRHLVQLAYATCNSPLAASTRASMVAPHRSACGSARQVLAQFFTRESVLTVTDPELDRRQAGQGLICCQSTRPKPARPPRISARPQQAPTQTTHRRNETSFPSRDLPADGGVPLKISGR